MNLDDYPCGCGHSIAFHASDTPAALDDATAQFPCHVEDDGAACPCTNYENADYAKAVADIPGARAPTVTT